MLSLAPLTSLGVLTYIIMVSFFIAIKISPGGDSDV